MFFSAPTFHAWLHKVSVTTKTHVLRMSREPYRLAVGVVDGVFEAVEGDVVQPAKLALELGQSQLLQLVHLVAAGFQQLVHCPHGRLCLKIFGLFEPGARRGTMGKMRVYRASMTAGCWAESGRGRVKGLTPAARYALILLYFAVAARVDAGNA